MTVDEPVALPSAPVELDVTSKNPSVNSSPEEGVPSQSKFATQEKNCLLAISTLACLLLLIVLISVMLFIPFSGGAEIFAEEFPIIYNDRNIILGDLPAQTVEYLTFNLSSIELAEGTIPSFYGCVHSTSVDVFACISQGTIPSYSECENLLISDYYDVQEGVEVGTGFLNGYAVLPRCGLNVLTLPEFQLCNLHENVWISVFNADYSHSHAYEVTVNYADCTECVEPTYQCIPNPFLLATSAILLIVLAALMCCASLLVICRSPKEDDEEKEDSN